MRRISLIILVLVLQCTFVSDASADDARREYLARERQLLRESPLDVATPGEIPMSLAACIEMALLQNAKVAAHDEALIAAQAQHREAKARWWPIFDYEYLTGPAPGDVSDVLGSFASADLAWAHRAKIGLGIPLYSFGKLSVLDKLARQGVEKAVQDKRKEEATVISEIRQLYYALQLGEGIASVLIEAIDALSEQIVETNIGEDPEQTTEGVSPIKKLELQLLRAELEKRLSETRTKQRVGIHALRVQTGLPAGRELRMKHRELHALRSTLAPLNTYIAQAHTSRADAQLLEVGIEAKRLEFELEKRKRLPDIGVGGFVELGRTVGDVDGVTSTDDYNDPFNFTRGGLGVQVKGRFDPHGGAARVRKKRHEYYQVRMQRDIARDGIALQVREAYEAAHDARAGVARAEESAAVARRMFFLAKSNRELGIGESDEYIESLKQVLLTRGQVYEAMFTYNSARAKLDEHVGISSFAESHYE